MILDQVLDTRGLECDERISKLSEEQLREILEEVRKLRRKRRRLTTADNKSSSTENEENEEEEGELEQHDKETPYIR
jgi:ABC-type phosphate transport system auxiliary subunit